jgi:hypothetical protein
MEQEWPAPWIAGIYLEKISRALHKSLYYFGDADWRTIAEHLVHDGNAEDVESLRQHRDEIVFLLEHDAALTAADREALQSLRDAASP